MSPPNMALNALDEKEVLKPVPEDGDPDEWPCHVLQQAIICSQNRKSMVNLLEAELHGPFIIQGKLEVDKQYRSQFLKSPRSQIIEVSSDLFSIGDGPNGQVTIWAGGNCGWFEIVPSPAYKEEYENMAVAVKLYYTVLDCITEAKPSRKNNLDIGKIFDAYSVKEHGSTLNREDVAELCRIHGVFLLSMMRRPATEKEWKSTSIFKWLVQELPDIIPQLEVSSGRRASQSTQNVKKSNSKQTSTNIPIRGVIDLTQDEDIDLPANSSPKAKGRSVTIDEETIVDSRPRRSRKSGKRASLRLATPKKRPRSISVSDDDEDIPIRSMKRQRSLATNTNDEAEDTPPEDVLEDRDIEDEGDEDEDEEDTDEKEVEEEPEEDVDVEEHLQLSLESLTMPSFEPVGPDGLWKCPRKGCKYFLHGVEQDAVQEQIRKHFLKHAENIRAQLARFKTVKQESKPHLPLTHLLEKLRRVGEAARLQEEAEEEKIEGKPVPKLIRRKMLI